MHLSSSWTALPEKMPQSNLYGFALGQHSASSKRRYRWWMLSPLPRQCGRGNGETVKKKDDKKHKKKSTNVNK